MTQCTSDEKLTQVVMIGCVDKKNERLGTLGVKTGRGYER